MLDEGDTRDQDASGEDGGRSILYYIFVLPLKIVWRILVVSTPLVGVWVASSLAAYYNGPIWLACAAGFLLFPALPAAWEWRAHRRRRARLEESEDDASRPRILSLSDRMTLRTLSINLAFLGALLALNPRVGFEALSTRGDWMLPERTTSERTTSWTRRARTALFGAADGLEWLYELSRDNPYDTFDDGSGSDVVPEPNEVFAERENDDGARGAKLPASDGEDVAREGDGEDGTASSPAGLEGGARAASLWPRAAELHPAVASLPESVETDYASVARHLAGREDDPFLLAKALHDYIADRVAYDVAALRSGRFPPQDAETVFRTRKAVCAGYAKLMIAMSEEAGIDAVYVTGDSREMDGDVSGSGHAWNAVELDGDWYLMDVTWDAGHVEGDTFERSYSTEYLFTPPKVFALNHLPADERWQLVREPISRGTFMRQPLLRPRFYARRFDLLSPERSQVEARGDISVALENPSREYVLGHARSEAGGSKISCDVSHGARTTVDCDLPRDGIYHVKLFSSPEQYGSSYNYIGQIVVTNRI